MRDESQPKLRELWANVWGANRRQQAFEVLLSTYRLTGERPPVELTRASVSTVLTLAVHRLHRLADGVNEAPAQRAIPRSAAPRREPPPVRRPSPDNLGAATELVEVFDRLDALVDGAHIAPDAAEALRWTTARLAKVAPVVGLTQVSREGRPDPMVQEIVGTAPTTDPTLVGRVAATLRRGFLFNGELLRPARVVVYALQPTTSRNAPTHEDETA